MPLSKKRNRERMRQSRLHKAILPPQRTKPVQPKYIVRPSLVMPQPETDVESVTTTNVSSRVWIDADGNPIYDD